MTEAKKRVFIAVPSMDYVAAGFAQSLATLNKPAGECAISFVCGSLIYDARNKLAAQAIKMEADYVMWFDSDMVFQGDTLLRLLKTMEEQDADIVSGLYFRRSSPYTPVAFQTFDIVNNESVWTNYEGELSGVHEVGAVGFGCVLMKSDVIFEVYAKYGDCFSPVGKAGEDLSFCWRARQLGYKVLLDADVKCGHYGHVTITESFYKAIGGKKDDEG